MDGELVDARGDGGGSEGVASGTDTCDARSNGISVRFMSPARITAPSVTSSPASPPLAPHLPHRNQLNSPHHPLKSSPHHPLNRLLNTILTPALILTPSSTSINPLSSSSKLLTKSAPVISCLVSNRIGEDHGGRKAA